MCTCMQGHQVSRISRDHPFFLYQFVPCPVWYLPRTALVPYLALGHVWALLFLSTKTFGPWSVTSIDVTPCKIGHLYRQILTILNKKLCLAHNHPSVSINYVDQWNTWYTNQNALSTSKPKIYVACLRKSPPKLAVLGTIY